MEIYVKEYNLTIETTNIEYGGDETIIITLPEI